jgi:DNA-binding NtrC family response regulator
MQLLLIADKDIDARKQMAGIFGREEFQVIEAESVDVVLHEVLKRDVRVVLLGSEFDGLSARELIPLLKKCKRDLTIILVSNDESLPLIRRFRREGIFYHSLKPISEDDKEELRQVVHCAFENSSDRRYSREALREKLSLKEHPA